MIQLEHVSKAYNGDPVLQDVSLSVQENEVLVLCGPSGAGKSTLLRCINGLEPIQAGQIKVDGFSVNGNRRHLQQVRGRVGMVFQEFNLYSHLSVMSNLTLASIKVQKVPRREAQQRAQALLQQLGLADKAKAYPAQLSGGEKQRVAIARSLMLNPKVLLLDEITSNLDPERVDEVLEVIGRLAQQGQTMVVVTHHIGFARQIADRMAFLDEGKILEVQPTELFFIQPQHLRTRQFLQHAYLREGQGSQAEKEVGGENIERPSSS